MAMFLSYRQVKITSNSIYTLTGHEVFFSLDTPGFWICLNLDD